MASFEGTTSWDDLMTLEGLRKAAADFTAAVERITSAGQPGAQVG